MKRLLVAACAALAAAVLVPSALAAYTPRLEVRLSDKSTGGGGPVTLRVSVPQADSATARLVLYAPEGFRPTLGQNPGSTLGTVTAQAVAKGLGGALLPLQGQLVVDDPAKYLTNACAPGAHQGVWVMRLTASGQALDVPVYVDEVTEPAEAQLGGLRLQLCLGSPDVPPAQGGAPFGAKLVSATLELRGVLSNPVARGEYTFRSLWTPYTAGTGTASTVGTVEARAVVRLPGQLTVSTSLNRRTGFARIFGRLTEAGRPVGGAVVSVYAGATARGAKPFRNVRTSSRGEYRADFKLRRGWTRWFRAFANVPVRTVPCTGELSTAPGGCVSQTLSPFSLFTRTSLRVRF